MNKCENKFDPIVSFIMQLSFECVGCMNSQTHDQLEALVETYVNKQVSYYAIANVFTHTIGTTKPIERLTLILNMEDVPLPNITDYPPEAQSFLLKKKTRPWTEFEDNRLLAGIQKYGLEAWGSVAQFVGNSRTKSQCAQRWSRGLDPRISKVQWTAEEDKLLLKLVGKYGQKYWTKLASEFPNRCDVQCRYRYKQICRSQQESQMKITQPPAMNTNAVIPKSKPLLPSIDNLLNIAVGSFQNPPSMLPNFVEQKKSNNLLPIPILTGTV